MRFDAPLWLLLLLAVPAVGWLSRYAAATAPARQRRWAGWSRAATVGLLALALAAPRWQVQGRAVDVVFLVDASDSVVPAARAEALAWIGEALRAKAAGDRAALAVFGADARVDHPLRADPPPADDAVVVDASGTDVANALQLAQGLLGGDNRRRVVVLTDGRPTSGDAVAAARRLASDGIAVDVVRLPGTGSADVLVGGVEAPARVRRGESYPVVVSLHNTAAEPSEAVLTVAVDGREVERRRVTLPPGTTRVELQEVAGVTGTVRYEARLASGASAIAANDVGRAAVQVTGPASVLLVATEPEHAGYLADALDAAGVPTRISDELPSLDRLLDHDAAVLVDVPADALDATDMRALDTYVREAGRGLVAVGGDSSYGLGNYDGTPLEDLLPVFARIRNPQRRPSVAEALVVDVSGSMAACHCRDPESGLGNGPEGMEMVEGGIDKTDISREAVARAIDALEAEDTVGVLAFNTESEWVIPLQTLPEQGVVDAGLARLHPEGGTAIPQAVRAAIEGLKDTDARLRHIVLFSDGFTEEQALIDVAREAAEAGITLSVVGTGEGSGEVLEEMAAAGGGRYYPGRDLSSIPDIIVNEVKLVARPIVQEGRFVPTVTGLAPTTEGLDAAPPLLGYLATTAKPTARTLLAVGQEHDPLLSTWQAGLGSVVAWTSDASARWSAAWVDWERFAAFWADVVKSTFPADRDPRFSLHAVTSPEGLRVRLESADALPADVRAAATVTDPAGERHELALDRTSFGAFEATVPGGATGIYAVSATLTAAGGEPLFHDTVAAIRSYSPEYAPAPEGGDAAERIAAVGEGRVDIAPTEAFDPAGLAAGRSWRALWPLLALLAVLLLPGEVGLRRLRLERGDLPRLLRGLRLRRVGTRQRPPAAPAPPDVAASDGPDGGGPPQVGGDRDEVVAADGDAGAGERTEQERTLASDLLAAKRRARDQR